MYMSMNKILLFIFSILFLVCSSTQAQDNLRPPAFPLVTVDPNFSIWAMQDSLNAGPTRHWTERPHSLQGIIRVDGKAEYFLGEPIPEYRSVLPIVGDTGAWLYTLDQPGNGWQQPGYKAENWTRTTGAFSDYGTTPNAWTTENIWVRRTFELNSLADIDTRNLRLNMYHDDNVKIYINGVLAYEKQGWVDEFHYFKIRDEALRALREGRNVLAVHCENTAGGAYLDLGLAERKEPELRLPDARQTDVQVTATQSVYTFRSGPVELRATFTAPLLPDRLELISRPANYLTFDVKTTDGQPHQVQLYLSAASNIAVNTIDQPVVWQRMPSPELDIIRTGTATQQVLGRKGDNVRIDWGYLYLATPDEAGASHRLASSSASVIDFADDGRLSGPDDTAMPRPPRTEPLTLAAAFDFGSVSRTPERRHAILAYDDLLAIEYFHQPLQAWWKKEGATVVEMLEQSEKDYKALMEETAAFDRQLFEQAKAAGGTKYAELAELAYRQAVAAHKLVVSSDGEPLFFSKENFSNGSIGTVDVTYPSSPLFLYYNATLLKAMLDPIFFYTESGRWTKPFPAHDVGTYPIANGQTYGEDMPVEEAGNMLIMTTAIARAEGNPDYARKHWDALTTWANYLMENGMDPKNQLSTDDFSGHLARNANLSIKAVLGIAGYGRLAGMMGKEQLAERYTASARRMARKWMDMADAGDHYMLAFGRPDTWSQKYNLVWDQVLDLNVFPDRINRKEINFYLTRQNEYGLPLDNRAEYTKSDWIVWTATLADDPATFRNFIAPMYRAYHSTEDRVPMTDWYQTDSGDQVGFQARSVVGGYFMKMLEEKFDAQ